MGKKRRKPMTEQWDSIAVITVMIKGEHSHITSEGCGDAGKWADSLIELAKAAMSNTTLAESDGAKR
jgi:hypothetical protein